MTTLKPQHPKFPLPVELLDRLIDTMTALESIEEDFRAAKLQLETISDIIFEMTHCTDANGIIGVK